MTIPEFAVAVVRWRRRYHGWITSWGRSNQHAIDVGGHADDPHTWDLGADCQYPATPTAPGTEHHPVSPASCPTCSPSAGLKVIHEPKKRHDHLQPLDFPAGSVTQYGGVMKDWA